MLKRITIVAALVLLAGPASASVWRKQSSTTRPVQWLMVDSADHLTPKTGLTVTATCSKDGGAFGACSGSVTEVGNGIYSLAGNATDRATLGTLVIRATATGADTAYTSVEVVLIDPFDASFGLTIPTAAATADAVWDELLADHNTASTFGANGNLIDDINTSTSLITSSSISIRQPVSLDGSVSVVKGDSYTNAEGTALPFTVGSKPWPTDLTGYTITIVIDNADGTTMLTDTLSITTATGSSRAVRWEPTAAETATLTTGTFKYEIKATKSSEVKRLELGSITVRGGTT